MNDSIPNNYDRLAKILQTRAAQGGNGSSFQLKNSGPSGKLILLVIVLVIGAAISYPFYFAEKLYPNAITGELVDVAYIPRKDKPGLLWFQTDGSFYYTSRVETASSLSISSESLFNKLYNYTYDPIQKKVGTRVKTEYPNTPPHAKIFYANQLVWMVAPTTSGQEALVDAYDPETGSQTFNTTSFIARNPDLKSGLAELTLTQDSFLMNITTHDGKKFVFEPNTNILSLATDYNKKNHDELYNNNTPSTIFTLSGEDDDRQDLYLLHGPKTSLISHSFRGNLNEPNNLDKEIQATHLTPTQSYLGAAIIYQDSDFTVILSQDQIGKNAQRLLTAVSNTGKVLWTLPQDQLFPGMGVSESDAFSSLFFMKDKFHGHREGNLFLFKMDGAGILAVDLQSNQKLWTFNNNVL